MRKIFIPKTALGTWSVVISILFIILIWTKIQFSIHVPSFAIATSGVLGFVVSLVAIFRNKERAILVFLPVLVGLLIIVWGAAELISPH